MKNICNHTITLKSLSWGYRDGSAVKSIILSQRTWIQFPAPTLWLTTDLTSVPGTLMPSSSGLLRHKDACPCAGKTHEIKIHIFKIFIIFIIIQVLIYFSLLWPYFSNNAKYFIFSQAETPCEMGKSWLSSSALV